jgi:hypothetical protein
MEKERKNKHNKMKFKPKIKKKIKTYCKTYLNNKSILIECQNILMFQLDSLKKRKNKNKK